MPSAETTFVSSSTRLNRWRELCAAVAHVSSNSFDIKSNTTGELTVIGSGLSICDFAVEAEDIIRDADHVFYLLYDKIAQNEHATRPQYLARKVPSVTEPKRLWDVRRA